MQSVRRSSPIIARDAGKRPVLISPEEVSFHPHSFADDAGRLFRWKGQIYRGINTDRTNFFEELFRDGVVQQLVERGLLIDTTPTDLTLDGYSMVVKHRTIPFVSYPQEWSAAMLSDAAVATIDLTIELARWDLTLKDAHPWNVLFDAYSPVWVDLTSIMGQGEATGWRAYDEFCRFCYYPLILMAHGHERIARVLLPEYRGVQRSELVALMRGSGPSRLILSKLLRRGVSLGQSILMGRSRSAGSPLAFLKQMRRDLEQISLPACEDKQREACDEYVRLQSSSALPRRHQLLRRILGRLQPGAVLDLSRDGTWSSILPAMMGFDVISADEDSVRATTLYRLARENRLRILPLIMEFIKPTPALGHSNHYSIGAADRLRCDLVLALGLAQRVALKNHLPFDLIAEGLSSFSKRWLVVDFVKDQSTGSSNANRFDSRELDALVASLRKQFSDVTVVSSSADPDVWLLCEKRQGLGE